MNTLTIQAKDYCYEVDGVAQPKPYTQSEFLIDSEPLGITLGFEEQRPWFGCTCFEGNPKVRDELVLQLKGLATAANQFGTNRFVLYGCHCGCDYCGVVSCEITRDTQTVHWIDIRSECDGGSKHEGISGVSIPLLIFDAVQYDMVIDDYLKRST